MGKKNSLLSVTPTHTLSKGNIWGGTNIHDLPTHLLFLVSNLVPQNHHTWTKEKIGFPDPSFCSFSNQIPQYIIYISLDRVLESYRHFILPVGD